MYWCAPDNCLQIRPISLVTTCHYNTVINKIRDKNLLIQIPKAYKLQMFSTLFFLTKEIDRFISEMIERRL